MVHIENALLSCQLSGGNVTNLGQQAYLDETMRKGGVGKIRRITLVRMCSMWWIAAQVSEIYLLGHVSPSSRGNAQSLIYSSVERHVYEFSRCMYFQAKVRSKVLRWSAR